MFVLGSLLIIAGAFIVIPPALAMIMLPGDPPPAMVRGAYTRAVYGAIVELVGIMLVAYST